MSHPALRVLLLEDSPTDAKLLLAELRKSSRAIEVQRVETAAAMRAALAAKTWDVVISDWSMPTFSAPDALAIVKELALDLPFIIVSGTIGEETAADAMRSGAHDYVLKDKLDRLRPAIDRELREAAARTERRNAEDALRRSQSRLRRLSESGLFGMFVSEMTGRVVEANDTFLATLGYSQEELANGLLSWTTMTPPEWADANVEIARALLEHGVAKPREKEYFRKDGTRVPVLVGVARLSESDSISISIDLTDKREAEAGRSRAEQALRRSEEQFRQAQKMEAVGRLAGGLAHDFNNMLSVILSYSEILLSELPTAEPIRADIGEIHHAATRASRLTHQLLAFSRQQVVEPKLLDLNEILASLHKMLQRLLGEDVDLVSATQKPVGRIKADPGQIEQVILNLVVNARDAMPTGGKLTIETANVVLGDELLSVHLPGRPGPHVMLAVTDTGCGMDQATQSRIFEPFFTTKERGKGTGLGLSTVFGIVQQTGGTIACQSEVGAGTTFRVYLPLVDAPADSPDVHPDPASLRGDETILVVEDEPRVRTIVVNALRRQGYRVLSAATPGEALLLCETEGQTIHLLLTDVVMPQMGGPALAKRLAPLRPAMKVLFMSGYTDDSALRHGALEGGMAYMQKPVTPGVLARKVREVLDRPSTSAPPAGNPGPDDD